MQFTEKRSDQIGLAIIATLLVLILFLLANISWSTNLDQSNDATITVSGEGRAFVVPDTGTFSYTLRGEGATAQAAQQSVATAASSVVSELQSAGVAESDIKTQYYNVSPRYEYRRVSAQPAAPGTEIAIEPSFPGDQTRVLVGYEAVQTDQVRVRNVDDAGELLGLATSAGASDVSQLDFIVWDESAVDAVARAAAIDDARAKADELADQLGVRLGDIVEFYETDSSGYQPMYARMEMAMDESVESMPANVSLGENEVRKVVNITFEIK